MNKFKILICIGLALITLPLSSQVKYSVSGLVSDSLIGEPIIGAVIRVQELKSTGTVSDLDGNYSLLLPQGNYVITAHVIGMIPRSHVVALNADYILNFRMTDTTYMHKEVVISATHTTENVTSAESGTHHVDLGQMNAIPALFGEKDIIRTIQLLPGIKSAGDGGTGFYVRGGATDQNQVLLDESTVYSPSHLLGFFSSFNADVLGDVTVYKGTQPAQFGGRLSSALDVHSRFGNSDSIKAGGGIGLIASRLYVEGPLDSSRSSFLIAGRRTYADAFLKLSQDTAMAKNRLYFYDLNSTFRFQLNDHNRIDVSGYYGRDVVGLDKYFNIDWGNAAGSLRWNHIWNERLLSNTYFTAGNYDYQIRVNSTEMGFSINSAILDRGFKHELVYFPNESHNIRFGLTSTLHTVTPGQVEAEGNSPVAPMKLQERKAIGSALFFSDEWNVSSLLNLTYGVRVSAFNVMGNGDFFSFNENGQVIDTTVFGKNEIVKTYWSVEPRISASLLMDEVSSVKVSYNRNAQNLHLLSNSVASGPTDIWIMSSPNVRPEISNQISIGYYRSMVKNAYELTAELYYKSLSNQIDFRNGANMQSNELIEGELLIGTGRAYGMEVQISRKTGKLTGWLSYTLSRSERQVEGINDNNWFPVRHDRTHDFAIVAMYELSKRWSLAATWVYNTGYAVTFPESKYYLNGEMHFSYSDRNGYRMPDYHRLDLGATYKLKVRKSYESELNFSVYNAYARENAYIITFRESQAQPGETEAVRLALFRIVPSVTYNFKF